MGLLVKVASQTSVPRAPESVPSVAMPSTPPAVAAGPKVNAATQGLTMEASKATPTKSITKPKPSSMGGGMSFGSYGSFGTPSRDLATQSAADRKWWNDRIEGARSGAVTGMATGGSITPVAGTAIGGGLGGLGGFFVGKDNIDKYGLSYGGFTKNVSDSHNTLMNAGTLHNNMSYRNMQLKLEQGDDYKGPDPFAYADTGDGLVGFQGQVAQRGYIPAIKGSLMSAADRMGALGYASPFTSAVKHFAPDSWRTPTENKSLRNLYDVSKVHDADVKSLAGTRKKLDEARSVHALLNRYNAQRPGELKAEHLDGSDIKKLQGEVESGQDKVMESIQNKLRAEDEYGNSIV